MESRQKILISVVVPAFNAQDTIEAALASVAEQVVDGIEIIVVDDASMDSTVEIVRAWGEGRVAKLSSCQVVKFGERERDGKQDRGQRIDVSVNTTATASILGSSQPTTEQLNNSLALRILVLDKNAGPAAARNRGIAEAKGEWIAFLDADDEWLPGKLALQLRLAEAHPEIDLWCGEVAPLAPQTTDHRLQTIDQGQGEGEGRSTGGEVVKSIRQLRSLEDKLSGCSSFAKATADKQVVELGKGERGETEDRGRRTRGIAGLRECGIGGQREDCRPTTEQLNNLTTSPNDRTTKEPNNPATGQLVQELTLADFVVANPIATSTVMVRKSVLEEVGGFDESFRGPEDYDLWLRIAARQPAMQTEDGRLKTEDRGQRSEVGGEGRLRDTEADCRPQTADYRQGEGAGQISYQQLTTSNLTTSPNDPTTEQLNNSATAICHIAKLHAPLALYRSEAGSLSMDDRKFLPQVLRVLDKAFGEGGALAEFADMKKQAVANQYWNASWMAFNRGSRCAAIRMLLKGWCLGGRELRRPWLRLLMRYAFGRSREARLGRS